MVFINKKRATRRRFGPLRSSVADSGIATAGQNRSGSEDQGRTHSYRASACSLPPRSRYLLLFLHLPPLLLQRVGRRRDPLCPEREIQQTSKSFISTNLTISPQRVRGAGRDPIQVRTRSSLMVPRQSMMNALPVLGAQVPQGTEKPGMAEMGLG